MAYSIGEEELISESTFLRTHMLGIIPFVKAFYRKVFTRDASFVNETK